MIIFKDVCKTYYMGDEVVHALDHANIHIKPGEFVSIIGPSGSGKSTLMNIMGCLDVASSGEYYLDGLPIETYSEKELAKIRNKKIGFIFQSFNLISTMTAEENVELPLIYQGVGMAERKRRVKEALEMVDLYTRRGHTPNQMSGGQQQRVAIARAMASKPSLYLADEPTGNLDPETSENIMAILQEINRSGSTVVVCTHDSNLVDRMKKRVIEIDSGLIARDEEDSKYQHTEKPAEAEFTGYGIENPGFAFGDDPNFKEDADYSDDYDDDGYANAQKAAANAFFFGETPPDVVAAQKEAEAKAAAAAAALAAKALEEASDLPEELPMVDDDDLDEDEITEESVDHLIESEDEDSQDDYAEEPEGIVEEPAQAAAEEAVETAEPVLEAEPEIEAD